MRSLVVAIALVCAVNLAAAEPKLAIPTEALEKIASEPAPAPHLASHDDTPRGIDGALVKLVERASALAARLTGLGRPIGAYAHVGDAPRVLVFGLRIGAPVYLDRGRP